MQKLFSFMKSHLLIFAFVSLAQGDLSKKLLLRLMSNSFLPMFSSKISMVSELTFKTSIPFVLLLFFLIWCKRIV